MAYRAALPHKISTVRTALFSGCALALLLAPAAHAQTTEGPETEGAGAQATDEIIVEGFRASLTDAINVKRNSSQIVDTVSAEDIGAFPDTNIAESLQRITGVQFNSEPIQGDEIQIRGLRQNRVELNGRSLLGADARRNVNFEDIPPTLLAGIDVYKSPSASQIEGGVGGHVNLRTNRPLSFPGFKFSAVGEGVYSDPIDKKGYRASALISDRVETGIGEFGALLNVAIENTYGRRDEQQVFNPALRTNLVAGSTAPIFSPQQARLLSDPYQSKRYTANAILEWAPTPDGKLYLEGFYTDFTRTSERRLLILDAVLAGRLQPGFTLTPEGVLATGRFVNANTTYAAQADVRSRQVYNLAAGGEWTFGKLKTSFEASYGNGSGGGFRFAQINAVGMGVNFDLDLDNPGRPFSVSNTSANFGQASTFVLGASLDNRVVDARDQWEAKFDLDYEVADQGLTSIEAGVRFTGLNNDRFRRQINVNLTPRQIRLNTVPALLGNESFLVDFLAGSEFVGFDLPPLISGPVIDGSAAADLGIVFNRDATLFGLDAFDIAEKTSAAYFQLNFEDEIFGVPMSGNAGVRIVHTSLDSAGSIAQPNGSLLPLSTSRGYTDVLPSFNLAFDLSDNFKVRLAGSKAVAPQEIIDLRVGTALNFGNFIGQAGNPFLDPFRATQIDLSFEWYFDQGSILSLAFFNKDVESFVQNRVFIEQYLDGSFPPILRDFQVTRPSNAASGFARGFEVGFVDTFDFLPAPFDGLGIQANYTYIDTQGANINRAGNPVPLEDFSKHSYNLVGFYQKGPITARVAYNWRDKFLDTTFGPGGTTEFRDARGLLSASLDIKLTDWLTITADGRNITRSPIVERTIGPELQTLYARDERQFSIGARVSF
jgi:iron complex outermembrane recepter protein